MLLAIDIGNTNIVLGVFNRDKLVQKWRLATDISKTEDEYAIIINNLLQGHKITQAIFSSVVPHVNNTFCKLISKYYHIEPLIVSSQLNLGIQIKYPNPEEIGADRLVNAVAATHIYSPPLIIIDFGTATTFCYVDKNSTYLGGLILPGIPLMLHALHHQTAKLPEVDIKNVNWVIGSNTIESIQAGVFHQTIGSINYILELLLSQYDKNAKIILTGGLGKLFASKTRYETILDPELTLKGLNIIHGLNKS